MAKKQTNRTRSGGLGKGEVPPTKTTSEVIPSEHVECGDALAPVTAVLHQSTIDLPSIPPDKWLFCVPDFIEEKLVPFVKVEGLGDSDVSLIFDMCQKIVKDHLELVVWNEGDDGSVAESSSGSRSVTGSLGTEIEKYSYSILLSEGRLDHWIELNLQWERLTRMWEDGDFSKDGIEANLTLLMLRQDCLEKVNGLRIERGQEITLPKLHWYFDRWGRDVKPPETADEVKESRTHSFPESLNIATNHVASETSKGNNKSDDDVARVIRKISLMLGEDGNKIITIVNCVNWTTDQKLRQLFKVDKRFGVYNSKALADLLDVSESSIRNSLAWKEWQPPRRPKAMPE